MKNTFTKTALTALVLFVFSVQYSVGQTSISGNLSDSGGEALIGANVIIKGTTTGTVSDVNGNFNLSVDQAPPFTILVSMVGYATESREIKNATTTGLNIKMEEKTILGQEVVVSASRVEESILESPVTVEKIDILGIQQSTAPSFFESISNLKGVTTTTGSLTFNAVNTRGFASVANTRFVTLVDGMDIAAPLLNFPTGNLVGISELDVESVELVPGAASALYGPNAFNGILFMNSKSPFDYQGLSAQAKYGITSSEAAGSDPLHNFSIRYAKAFNNKFAFKVNFSIFDAKDWVGNDYTNDRVTPGNQPGAPNFDGLNLYGDETRILLDTTNAIPKSFYQLAPLDLRRTGIKEELLFDNRDARSLKADVSLNYRINDKIEAIYNYRYGNGSSVYQGAAKYALRGFDQQFHKFEIKGDNFFVRAYRTKTNAGKSYHLDAMGGLVNERLKPSLKLDSNGELIRDPNGNPIGWIPQYLSVYLPAIQGYVPGVQGGNPAAAHAAARAFADTSPYMDENGNIISVPQQGTPEFQNVINAVRGDFFQGKPSGAGFKDGSTMSHFEGNYNFMNQIDWAEVQIGANFRRYNIFSDGTIFDEKKDADGNFQSNIIDEYGAYVQVTKRVMDDKLKLGASFRYDQNQNFKGQVSPRFSAVYKVAENNNIRASFQTGFRNPDSQAQYIWFPVGGGFLLGGAEENAAQYGIHQGGGTTDPEARDENGDKIPVTDIYVDYIQPEQLTAIEIGYKGVLGGKVLIDFNYYNNSYENFLGQQVLYTKNEFIRAGKPVEKGTQFILHNNSDVKLASQGIGLGLTYQLAKGYNLTGSYNWANFKIKGTAPAGYEAGFNTPKHKFNVSLGNRNVGNSKIGFMATFRWQDEFFWQSSFGDGTIPEFGTFDMQVNYRIESIKSMIKIGGTNLFAGDYRTNVGSAFVGQQYYISITVN